MTLYGLGDESVMTRKHHGAVRVKIVSALYLSSHSQIPCTVLTHLQAAQNGITSTDEMNSMLDFSGLENLDTSWLDGVNLLSWLLPGSDANQPISGPAFNVS
jgi:hypothetical protein